MPNKGNVIRATDLTPAAIGAVPTTDVVVSASANKILKLDGNGKLPASITGNADGNAATATKLQTARTITLTGDVTGSVSFDGSGNVSFATTYKNSGVTAGTYRSVTVDAKGNITAGTNPTTLAGYGITDAAPSGYGLGTSAQQLANGSDLNVVKTTGFYRINAAVNAPPRVSGDNSAVWHYVIVMRHDDTWVSQTAIEYSTGTMFTRALNSGTWTSWRKMWSDAIDGAGSGLDADLLDGLDSTAFGRIYALGNSEDLNTKIASGFYRLSNTPVNAPPSVEYGQMLVVRGGGDTIFQMVSDYNSPSVYVRQGNPTEAGGSGTYSPWAKLWNDQNMGANSGLDADMIDGVHLSGLVQTGEVVTTATANKILKLNGSGILPASITGNADTVDGKHVDDTQLTTGYLWTAGKINTELQKIVLTATATLPATAGWYRIAQTSVDILRASARFEVDWTLSGNHGQVIFNAATMFGNGVALNQTLYSTYNSSVGLTKARIVYHPTWSGNYAYLEIYNASAAAISVTVQMLTAMGWTLTTPSTAGSIPSGYSNREVTFVDGISTEGQLKSTVGTGTAPLSVSSTTVVPNLNADTVDGYHASSFLLNTGGNMTGDITFNTTDGTGITWSRNTDGASIKFYNTGDADTNSRLEFNLRDNYDEYFRWTAYSGGTDVEQMKLVPNTGTLTVRSAVTAPTFNGALNGNASTATKLQTARTIALTGDVSGSGTFDGSGNLTITTTVADDSHAHLITDVDGLQSALDLKAPMVIGKSFTVAGDAATYYPVVFTNNGSFKMERLQIYRGYSDTAPATWNTSTHKGGLLLDIEHNLYGWGGQNYELKVDLRQSYSKIVADITVANPETDTLIVWLRGGGAIYYFSSTILTTIATPYIGNYVSHAGDQYETTYAPKTTPETFFNFTEGQRVLVSSDSDIWVGGNYRGIKNANKVWHQGNDGAGSGLDADLFDGLDSTQFVRSDQSGTIGGTLTIGGKSITVGDGTASPNSGIVGDLEHYVEVRAAATTYPNKVGFVAHHQSISTAALVHVNTDVNNGYWDFITDDSGTLEVRVSGNKVWHAGNDGTGSGLDADLLDGLNSTQFLRSDVKGTIDAGNNADAFTVKRSSATSPQVTINLQTNDGTTTVNGFIGQRSGVLMYSPTSADLGATGSKIWHEGNDGAGSGLDADLFDGLNSDRFLYGAGAPGVTRNDDPNTLWKGGFYESYDAANAPGTGWYWIMNTGHTSNTANYRFNGQMAFKNLASGTPEAYIRTTAGNGTITATNWGRIWHDKNHGVGSGLNADMVDGYHVDKLMNDNGELGATVDWNTLTTMGTWNVTNGTTTPFAADKNQPVGAYGWGVLQIVRGGNNGIAQWFIPHTGTAGGSSTSNSIFVRTGWVGGSVPWYPWTKVWTDNNDGSGSGLDADLLDGLNSTDFIKKDGTVAMNGTLNMNANNITNINHIQIQDPGVNEGIEWVGGNGWKIFESPDSLTNAAGNLQIVTGSTRNVTVDTNGSMWVRGSVTTDGNFSTTNPNNTAATAYLGWANDIARIRYGGSGVGSAGGFQIQGTGDSVKFSVDNAGNIEATNTAKATAFGGDDVGVFVDYPKGGRYSTQTSSVTGAIQIKLPVLWTNTMMRFAIDVYEYTTGESFTVYVGGYNYASNSAWANTTAYILANKNDRDFNIRFGHDGTKACVWIGETTSAWAYPQVVVRDFYAGFQGLAYSTWKEGWNVSFVTTLGTVSTTQSDNFVRASYSKDSDLLDGLNSAQFLRSDVDDSMNGVLTLNRSGSHLKFQESSVDKWHLESVSNSFKLVETGVATQILVAPGGDTTIYGALNTSGNIEITRTGGQMLSLKQTDSSGGMYNYIGFNDSSGQWQGYVGYSSAKDGVLRLNNSLGSIEFNATGGQVVSSAQIVANNGIFAKGNTTVIHPTNGSYVFYVDATNQKIGVNKSNPTYILDVQGTIQSDEGYFRSYSNDAANYNFVGYQYASAVTESNPGIYLVQNYNNKTGDGVRLNYVTDYLSKIWLYTTAYYDRTTYYRSMYRNSGGMIGLQATTHYLYFGDTVTFTRLYFDISSGAGLTLAAEYWNGTAWTAFSFTDGTANLTKDGWITWSTPAGWAQTAVNGTTLYYVRFRTTTTPTSPSYIITADKGNFTGNFFNAIHNGSSLFNVNQYGDVNGTKFQTDPNLYFSNNYDYGLHLNNSDIVGANNLVFGDECTSDSEAIQFPKTGYSGSSLVDDYDHLRALDGQLLFNSKLVDHIVEQGYNGNGDYLRYNSGLQICWLRTEGDCMYYSWSTVTANGSPYWYTVYSWTFPAAFKSGTGISLTASGDIPTPGPETHIIYFNDYTKATSEAGIYQATNPGTFAAGNKLRRTFMAIGFWK